MKKLLLCTSMIFIMASLYGIDQNMVGKWYFNRHSNANARDLVIEFTKDKIFVEKSIIEIVNPRAAEYIDNNRLELSLHSNQSFASGGDGNRYWGYWVQVSLHFLANDKLLFILYVSSFDGKKEYYNEMTFILTK